MTERSAHVHVDPGPTRAQLQIAALGIDNERMRLLLQRWLEEAGDAGMSPRAQLTAETLDVLGSR